MKKFNKYFLPLLLIVLIAFVSTCKKDEEEEAPEYVNPSFAGQTELITAPEALATSGNYYASIAYTYVTVVNAYASLFGNLVLPANATQVKSTGKSTQGGVTYTWSDGIHSVWVTYTETSSKYTWEYDYDEGEGRYHLIYAEEQKDGSGGLMKFNDVYYEQEWDIIIEWTVNNDGSILWTWTDIYDNEVLEVLCNTDHSGYIKYYENDVLMLHITWDALGNGTWIDYSDDPPLSGSWSVTS
jgi:hypothetical protein